MSLLSKVLRKVKVPNFSIRSEPAITRDLVVLAYYLYLRRPPENEEVIRHHMGAANIDQLFANFTNSDEFVDVLHRASSNFGTITLNRLVGAAAQRIDTVVDEKTMVRLVRHVHDVWSAYGKTEPHWSVVTSESYLSDRIAGTREHFYQSGADNVKQLRAILERNGADISTLSTCLELGCGVGRVTQWLAREFSKVVAVDISRPHLDLAVEQLGKQSISNVDFICLSSLDDVEALPRYDLFYSLIVLQHNPPPVIRRMLATIFSKANEGGVCVFQIPTYLENYEFNIDHYLAFIEKRQAMEVHALPQHEIFALASAAGLSPLEVVRDGSVGGVDNVSSIFVFQKTS